MADANAYGILNVIQEDDRISIRINALQKLHDTLIVKCNDHTIHKEDIQMAPMDVFIKEIQHNEDGIIEVVMGDNELHYSSNVDSLYLKRPFFNPDNVQISERQKLIVEGLDAMNFREYPKAIEIFYQVLEIDPSDREGLLSLSEIHFRRAEYDKSLEFASKVLIQNTYDSKANYLAAISYQAKDDAINALESFGWAARSMEFRSGAYAQMAKSYIKTGHYKRAMKYAEKSLDFNRYSIPALEMRIITKRLDKQDNFEYISELREIDPLNHLTRYEEYLADKTEENANNFKKFITNELPEETYLEVALNYHSLGLDKEASEVLTLGPRTVKNDLWLSYLNRLEDPDLSMQLLSDCINSEAEFVFPYRPESIKMLEWARSKKPSWKLDYYQALLYAGLNRMTEASDILVKLDNNPDYWVFYLARVSLVSDLSYAQKERDILKANIMAPEEWRSWNAMIQFYLENSQSDVAVGHAKKAYKRFPQNYTLGFLYAKALLRTGKYSQCIQVLKNIQILPFEGAYESRSIYEEAHIRNALEYLSKTRYTSCINILLEGLEWPENIGVGKPYEPEQRSFEILLAYCYKKMEQAPEAEKNLDRIINYTKENLEISTPEHYLGLIALKLQDKSDEAEALLNRINNSKDIDQEVKNMINNLYLNQDEDLSLKDTQKSDYGLLSQISKLVLD
jgi:hypothetical protein